ncbi:MAG: type IV pilin N-terminal domain-containing protein [Methanolinea sp.]|jgi:porphobilinogen synthase|nr:type IV pilin N-terminal domain-containing protein [Methanolinea sp.]
MREIYSSDAAVSELAGALLLIAVISLAISILGVTILSNINVSQVPAVSFVIENESARITVIHAGGDSLPAGSYRIYVDGTDRTDEFQPSPRTTPFRPGTTLGYTAPSSPQNVMVISRGTDGREIMLVQKFFS